MEKDKTNKQEKSNCCEAGENRALTKKEIEQQNKLLKNILLGIGGFFLIILFIILFLHYIRNFEYEGIKFSIENYCDAKPCLILYKTFIPVIYNGKSVPYNFYLRNDPRKLDNIEFDSEIVLLENMVINMSDDIKCDSDEIIALANLLKLYEIIGTKVIKDENAGCDAQGRYMFLNIQKGEDTNIIQTSPGCYELNVNNCEILKVTEKFMIKTFIEIEKIT